MPELSLRPFTPDDMEFLFLVYASTRSEEMALTGWDETQVEQFLRMQFRLQHVQYTSNYAGAAFDVIEVDGVPAGRLYVDRHKDEISIIDIALLPEFRRRGLGSRLMNDLIAEADHRHVPLSLHVECTNPARQLYQRLGFEHKGDAGVYQLMKRPPRAHPIAAPESQEASGPPQAQAGETSPEALTRERFLPYLNDPFEILPPDQPPLAATLVEVEDLSTPQTECFSLIFRSAANRTFHHQTYRVRHSRLGEFVLFLGMIHHGKSDGIYFQAIINRLRQN